MPGHAADDPFRELEAWAEHRAALDATLFAGAFASEPIVLELREGTLRLRSPRPGGPAPALADDPEPDAP